MRLRWKALFSAGLFGLLGTSSVSAQGLMLPHGGATGGNMAGATTSVACDAVGALFWNPAVISGWPGNEVTIGSNLLFPRTGLSSSVPPGFARNGASSGRTASDDGVVPATALGWIYHDECSKLTYGLSMATVAAGGVNYPGDANNPILAPTGPLNQFILGPQAASLSVLQINPTVAYQLTDSLAVGIGPMIDVSVVSFDPAFFGPTSQANPLAPKQFPTGSHTRPYWGGGFRGGVTYKATEHLTAGFSYSSPQWFETWQFNARDANGNAIEYSTQFSMPQIISTGLAYDGIKNLLLACDVRWMDYSTTQLMGDSVQDGGAGWRSIWATSVGGSYRVTDCMSVQAGYLWNQNPVPSNLALFNTMLPCITTNTLTCGAYYQINESIGMSLGYAHGFENSISGSVLQLARTSTTLDTKYDAIVVGLNIKFGGCGKGHCCEPSYGDGETFETSSTSAPATPSSEKSGPNGTTGIPLPMPKDAQPQVPATPSAGE